MRQLIAIAFILFVACAGWQVDVAATPFPSSAPQAKQDPTTITVYITKTGEKYHREGCSSLRRSKLPVSLKEAVARGYGACKVCKPPTIR